MKKGPMAYTLILSAAAALLITAGCAPEARYGSIENSVPTISVRGTGKVTARPDEALARFGVTSEEKTLEKAYKKNTESMNAVIREVKASGIEDEDIATSSYTVSPVYPRDEQGRQIPGKPASFRVSQELTIRIRDISKTGVIIDKAIASGTNTFNSIQFDSSVIEELEKEVKGRAALDAEEKAALLAGNLGVKLGRVLKVSESTVMPYPARNMVAMRAAAPDSAPQIEPGAMEITGTCDVIYEIIQ